jgi:hypothetical protein
LQRPPDRRRIEVESDARDLLHASILSLPLLLAAMMLDARGRLLF